MNGEGCADADAASPAGPEMGLPETPPPSPRRRTWLRRVLAVGGGIVAVAVVVAAAAAVWLVLDPGLLRPVVEYVATAAAGRPVVIGELELRMEEGRTVVEARKVRVGQTTTERVSISLIGMRSHVTGSGVRFPNGSSVDRFLASVDLSPTGRPRLSTVDATGAVLVAARRARADSAGSPPLARLLAVPRILLRLGLERLVLHSGELEYRGRTLTRSAGMTAVLDTTDEGLEFHGELLVGPGAPPLPFEGKVRDPMADDWRIDARLAGNHVPMEGVRLLAGVLEPGPTVRAALRGISSEARFLLSARVARERIEESTLDFTFEAPEGGDAEGISLEGVRFLATAVPDPGGWTVTGEVDWSRRPGGEAAEPSPFAVRWATGVPGSLRWSARRITVPLLAGVARSALPPGHALRPVLERIEPAGMIDELAAFGDPGAPGADSGEPSFWLSALVSEFGATAGQWRISDAGARIELVKGGWQIRFRDDPLHARIPSFRSAPYVLTLEGEVRVTDTGTGWTAHTGGLDFALAGLAGRIEGSLGVPRADDEAPPSLDAELRLDGATLADIGTLLPDRRAVAFTRWYRRAVRSGRIAESTVRIRGDPRDIPFPEGDGEFEAQGIVRGVDFSYAEGWPAVRIEEAKVRAHGTALEFSGIRGSIFDTVIEDGSARVPDTTRRTGRVRISLTGAGPARDLLEFARTSPLSADADGVAPDLRADGPAATTAELDLPYGRGAATRRTDVAGRISLDGVAVGLAGRGAVLAEVRGDLAFDAESLSGGPLHGRFRGVAIESRVDFDRDEGLRLRFSGEGDGEWFEVALEDLLNLGSEETEPWLRHIGGRASWDAEYRSRAGIAFRSDLRTASVDLPAPFAKPPGTPRRLEVLLTPGETEWLIDAAYGPDTRGVFEVAETSGEWALARGAVTLGDARPVLPAEGHVEVSGALADLDLDPWLAFGAGSAPESTGWLSRIGRISLDTTSARLLDRRIALARFELTPSADGSELHVRLAGEGIEGEIAFPADPTSGQARVRLARMHFDEPLGPEEDGDGKPPDGDAGREVRPDRWPSFDARIGSLRFAKLDLGTARAIGNRTESGLDIKELTIDSSHLRMRGQGSWSAGGDRTSTSRFRVRMKTPSLARLLSAAGLGDEMAAGEAAEIRFDLAWPGSPFDPSLARATGTVGMDAENGNLPRVRVGPISRLFALLSLDALPRVLALDLSHVAGRGFAYDRITARMEIGDGSAKIRELDITGPSARIEVSGRLDLVSRRYDQKVEVIPRLTRSGALLPVWTAAWPVLVANFLLEKVSGEEVILDRLFRLRYRVRGPLDNPEIERIKFRNSSTPK